MRSTGLIASLLVVIPLSVAAAADVSGNWSIDGDVQGNPVNLSCVFAQDAAARVSGKCDINGMENASIDGTVTDTTLQFAFTAAGYTLTYTGLVADETVSGDIEVAGVSGKFSGRRLKK